MRVLEIAAPLGAALLLYARRLGERSGARPRRASRACGSSTARQAASSAAPASSRRPRSRATLVGGLGAAYSVRPPTVHLHGVVQGPLVIRHAQTLVGGVVRGGIIDACRSRDAAARHRRRRRERHRHRARRSRHARPRTRAALDAERHPRARLRRDDRRLLDLVAGGPARQRHPHLLLDGTLDEHGRRTARSPGRARGSRRTRRWST